MGETPPFHCRSLLVVTSASGSGSVLDPRTFSALRTLYKYFLVDLDLIFVIFISGLLTRFSRSPGAGSVVFQVERLPPWNILTSWVSVNPFQSLLCTRLCPTACLLRRAWGHLTHPLRNLSLEILEPPRNIFTFAGPFALLSPEWAADQLPLLSGGRAEAQRPLPEGLSTSTRASHGKQRESAPGHLARSHHHRGPGGARTGRATRSHVSPRVFMVRVTPPAKQGGRGTNSPGPSPPLSRVPSIKNIPKLQGAGCLADAVPGRSLLGHRGWRGAERDGGGVEQRTHSTE